MRKPSIPSVPRDLQPRGQFDQSIKETLETITGQRGGKVAKLASDATLADVVSKVNELIDRLQ